MDGVRQGRWDSESTSFQYKSGEVSTFVIAGDVRISDQQDEFVAILGSCVAICLFDLNRKIGGMIHFVLPTPANPKANSPRYGENAVTELIQGIVRYGANRDQLQAKAFGGALVSEDGSLINAGAINASYAKLRLQQERIPIVGFRLGGYRSMKVVFAPCTGRVWVRDVST